LRASATSLRLVAEPLQRRRHLLSRSETRRNNGGNAMRHITVYMSDGDTIETDINGTDEEITRHYLGQRFEAGSDTEHHVALLVHFHDNDKKYGLRIKNIESGATGCIAGVRNEIVEVDDTTSLDEIILTTRGDSEYALNDVWVYDLNGEWIRGIGYKHPTAN